MPRPNLPGLQIPLGGLGPVSSPVDPYVRASPAGPEFGDTLDLGRISKTFLDLYARKSQEDRERLEAEGTAFAQNEPARTSAAQDAIEGAVSGIKDHKERLRKTKLAIGKLVESGVLPSAAASPVFQVGLSQAVARDLASRARRSLLGRLGELTVVRDGQDNPVQPLNVDTVIAEEFGRFADLIGRNGLNHV